jgi:uncharacterized membrane protein YhaH (DUF805 family)
MPKNLKEFADRSLYRRGSLALWLFIHLTIASALIGAPAWIVLIAAFGATIYLTIITYYRLHDAGLSGGWVLLLLLQIGPSGHFADYFYVNLGSSILSLSLIVALWFLPAKEEGQDGSVPARDA